MKLNKKNIYYGGRLHRKLRTSNKTSVDSFNEFINILGTNSKLSNATLLIGISYTYSKNLNREIDALQPDFCWTESSTDREYSNARNSSTKQQWYQLFFPFSINRICLTDDFFNPLEVCDFDDSNRVEQIFSYFQNPPILNKFSLIVFDSSTTKSLFPKIDLFVTYPSFISYLYYYFLEVEGEIYLNLPSTSLMFFQLNIRNITNLLVKLNEIITIRNDINNMKKDDKEIFGKKFIYIIYHTSTHNTDNNLIMKKFSYKGNEYEIPELNKEIIRENNIEHLRQNLNDSEIEYFTNKDERKEENRNRRIFHQSSYPIKKTNYPIGPFIKIKKTNGSRSPIRLENIERFKIIFDSIYKDLLIHKSNPETLLIDLPNLNCRFI